MSLFHKDLMDILICPLCDVTLELQVLSRERKDGILLCRNDHWYPVEAGLPRILVGGLRGDYSAFAKRYRSQVTLKHVKRGELRERAESRQVQDAFSEKWRSKDTIGISDSSPFKNLMRRWMLQKYGWRDESGFKKAIAGRKLILDAGTGLGREVINIAKAAEGSSVIGMEFSECAVNALKNVSGLKNAYIVQGDILRMPFREESFDFILSEGVLHHTPDPKEAFSKCCRVLRRGGEIAFYVYRKKGPAREFTDDYVRAIMQKASTQQKWEIANRITQLGRTLSQLKTIVNIPMDIPELGIKKGNIDIQRFIYWNFLKCYWNDELPLEENRMVNFDWFVPEHAHRVTEDEIKDWCRTSNIEITWFNAEESGYTVRGLKE